MLVMDEPTNDLDLETLELLEDLLLEYQGTLLLVSHDREFLNNVVTSTLALEGDGRVDEYAGGYDDWLRQRPGAADEKTPASPEKPAARSAAQRAGAAERPRRLTFKERQEMDGLPAHIEALEIEQHRLYQVHGRPRHLPAGRRRSGADQAGWLRWSRIWPPPTHAGNSWKPLRWLNSINASRMRPDWSLSAGFHPITSSHSPLHFQESVQEGLDSLTPAVL